MVSRVLLSILPTAWPDSLPSRYGQMSDASDPERSVSHLYDRRSKEETAVGTAGSRDGRRWINM